MDHCISVRTTPEGPALGLTQGDRSHLCSKVTLSDHFGEIAVVEAGPDGVQVTVAKDITATVG